MRVLIACEFSGVVRDAFKAHGHDAWSCDLLPSERNGQHMQCDVRDVLSQGWNLGVFFPPCTFLCNSGVRWLFDSNSDAINAIRWGHMLHACNFFNALLAAPIERIAIENPIQHCHARERIIKYDQIIHPWQFGCAETKSTCLWLRNLPKLQPTNIVEGRKPRVHYASPGPDRWKERSRTLQGIADAMAEQWGNCG